jgi:hypothetical protein
MRSPAVMRPAPARPASNIARKENMTEAALIGSLGSWRGERAAHRPIARIKGSAS